MERIFNRGVKALMFAMVLMMVLMSSGCISMGDIEVLSDPPGAVAHYGGKGGDDSGAENGAVTPTKDWVFAKWNAFGAAWAWVEWPDGVKSEYSQGSGKQYYFKKSDYVRQNSDR